MGAVAYKTRRGRSMRRCKEGDKRTSCKMAIRTNTRKEQPKYSGVNSFGQKVKQADMNPMLLPLLARFPRIRK